MHNGMQIEWPLTAWGMTGAFPICNKYPYKIYQCELSQECHKTTIDKMNGHFGSLKTDKAASSGEFKCIWLILWIKKWFLMLFV